MPISNLESNCATVLLTNQNGPKSLDLVLAKIRAVDNSDNEQEYVSCSSSLAPVVMVLTMDMDLKRGLCIVPDDLLRSEENALAVGRH